MAERPKLEEVKRRNEEYWLIRIIGRFVFLRNNNLTMSPT